MLESARTRFTALQNDLAHHGRLGLKVSTDSMMPVISPGTLIEVVPLNTQALRPFTIIVFWNGHELICHYVRHRNTILSATGQQCYVTGGLNGRDPLPVEACDVLGVVVSHRISALRRLWLVLYFLLHRVSRR